MGEGISILDGLNPVQREAASTIEGPVLILAGPGSGKTRVLTHRIAYMISEAQPPVDPRSIMAVTFTNKAAREMTERMDRLLVRQFGEGTQVSKQIAMGTFHSICLRILRRDGKHIGIDPNFSIYDTADQLSLIKGAMSDLGLSDKQFSPNAILSIISQAKSTLLTPLGLGNSADSYLVEVAARVYEKYAERLRLNRALDFDDLINSTIELYTQEQAILERYQDRYRYLMVDEYQDTNQAQYRFINLLASKYKNLCVVGDENQSIYGWRAADIKNILNFESDYPEARVIALEQNYRSTQVILDAATHLIQANRQRKNKKLWTENGAGKAIQVIEAYNEYEEAEAVVREIERLKARRDIESFRDIAVMYRTNSQTFLLERAFAQHKVPHQIVGGTRFYDRLEIKDTLAYLRLINNPYDGISFQRIMNNTPNGKGVGPKALNDVAEWAAGIGLPVYVGLQLLQSAEADRLARQRRGAPEGEDDLALPPLNLPVKARSALLDFVNLLNGFILAKDTNEMNLPAFLEYILKKSGYGEFINNGTPEGDERWENIQQLRNFTGDFSHRPLAEGLAAFLEEVSLVADVDKYDPNAEAVTLITLHAAKGLEFPIVFIVGLEEKILPHSRSIDNEQELEEERRLLYVGITRAMHRLYLLYAFRRTMWGKSEVATASRFLAEIPPNLIKGREQKAVSVTRDGQTGMFGPSAGRWNTGGGRSAGQSGRDKPAAVSAFGAPARADKKPAASGKLQFKAGDKVQHSKFGKGMVVSIKPSGDDEEIAIAFDGYGVKRLLASYAHLEKR